MTSGDRIEQELLAIKGKREVITAEDVVDWAEKHRNSFIAQRLEWDDKKAGHEFRINQARQLIISLEIEIGERQRRFYSLSIDRVKKGGGYRDISDILRNQSLYDVLLADALADLERMQSRYEQIKELKGVWRELNKVKGKRA